MGTKISIVENFLSYNYMVFIIFRITKRVHIKRREESGFTPSHSLDRQLFTVVSVVEHCLC